MQSYLRDNHGRRPAFNVNQRMELEFLRDQVQKLTSELPHGSNENSTADEARAMSDSDQSSEGSDGDDDDVFDLPIEEIKRNNANRGPRASVSAEAFGNWNKKEEFKAPFYAKTEELTTSLRNRLS